MVAIPMVAIPRGSTGYKVAARQSAPSGELPSDRHNEPWPVQSQYHLTCGGDRCRSLDRSSAQPSRKKERDIDVELDIERPIQDWGRRAELRCRCAWLHHGCDPNGCDPTWIDRIQGCGATIRAL